MNHSYTQIMSLPDSYGIKKIVRQWENLSENLERLLPEMPVLLPDLFMTAEYGVGRTLILRYLAEYLSSRKNLMDFYGDVKYFEFQVNYRKPEEQFTELPRLMENISAAAGFRSEYRGIVCLDVHEWLGHCDEKYFMELLEYIADNSDRWLVIFTVSQGSETDLKNMEAILSMFLRIERTSLCLPETEVLLAHVCDGLADYNIHLAGDAMKLLAASIDKLRENRYFDGYKTLNLLICDIVYQLYSRKAFDQRKISAKDLADFAADGSYIRNRISHYETKKRYAIGFTGGEQK
ncbi:MAG: hypothetical protein E7631_00655 [Ruminococcaceae bacterium]|nr:hypothetical protein [Oscillospiraceae bacterium]